MFSNENLRAVPRAAAPAAWVGFMATTLAAIVGLGSVSADSGSVIAEAVFPASLIWAVVAANMAPRSAEVLS